MSADSPRLQSSTEIPGSAVVAISSWENQRGLLTIAIDEFSCVPKIPLLGISRRIIWRIDAGSSLRPAMRFTT